MGYIIVTSLATGEQAFIGDGDVVKLPPISWRCDVCKANEHPENGQFHRVNHLLEHWVCDRCIKNGKCECSSN